MTPEERQRIVDERTRQRMVALVAANRTTKELFEALNLNGTPGYMGRGVYSTRGRQSGYLRGRN